MNQKIQTILCLFIGAIAIIFSGINWHNAIAAWIAPIFLLFYLRNTKWNRIWLFFIVLAIAGAVSQTANNLMHIPVLYIINGISFGILTIIPYLMDKALYKKNGNFYHTLIFPASIALIEFLASFIIGTWGSVAHTQFFFKPLMQLSSLLGINSIWFVVAWLASVLNWMYDNRFNKPLIKKGAFIYGSIFVAILIYGTLRTITNTKDSKKVKIATVVSNQEVNGLINTIANSGNGKDIQIPLGVFSDSLTIETLKERTQTAIKNNAKIIVWNEIALVLTPQQKTHLVPEIQNICKQNKVYVLMAYLEQCSNQKINPFNNIASLISPSGEVVWEYKKSYLEPSAEAKLVNAGDFNIPVIKTKYGNIGNVICADLDIPYYIKQAGQKSIDILLVPAYDWEEITPLHTRMAAIHAIQFGCNIVRSNGKGLSAFYNYKGKEIAALNNLQSPQKILYAELPVRTVKTIYSTIGNLLIVLSVIFLLFIIFIRIRKKKTENKTLRN